jgi:hypothetical protein
LQFSKGFLVVDFINEVEEELRKDEYNRLLRRYGPVLLSIIIIIVIIAGIIEFRKYSEDNAARATSASYVSASDKAAAGETLTAISDFLSLSEKAPSGYSGLALMRAAALQLDSGNNIEAVRLFDNASTRFTLPRHSQLAEIKAAYILASEGQHSDVINRLGPLAQKDAPYEFLARELLGLSALASGDTKMAQKQFSYLEFIPGVPPNIRNRAKQSLSLMKVNVIDSDGAETDINSNTVTIEKPNGN